MRFRRATTGSLGPITSVRRDIRRLSQLASDPKLAQSYYPLDPRKSRFRITAELMSWYLKHRDVNEYYYVYGLDRRSVNTKDYLAYPTFRSIRNHRNHRPASTDRFNYICVLQDKFVFSQFAKSLHVPTPTALALCKRDQIVWLRDGEVQALQELVQNGQQLDGFCKPLSGINGRGIFPLKISDNKLYIGEEKVTPAELARRMDTPYLIQDRVNQHPVMSTLHPHSLNTLRVVTFNTESGVRVFSAAQRVGTNRRAVDNWTAGGILIGVDIETGRLRADGFYKPGYGGRIQEHPQTGVKFHGFQIPHFQEVLDLVVKFHGYIDGIHSIGWDVAVSDSGPVVIEGNDDWDGAVPMALEQNFRKRFFEMYEVNS